MEFLFVNNFVGKITFTKTQALWIGPLPSRTYEFKIILKQYQIMTLIDLKSSF